MTQRIKIPETKHLGLSVNDNPTADVDLWQWFHDRGTVLMRANSTLRALELAARFPFDFVLSNLARVEGPVKNPSAGIELSSKLRQGGYQGPIVIYTLDKAPAVHHLALEAGASFVTEDPVSLKTWLQRLGL